MGTMKILIKLLVLFLVIKNMFILTNKKIESVNKKNFKILIILYTKNAIHF